ncbi:MAG: cell envelope integrity protein TolA [Planctomycetes bacterium]|nr:cell envelope integrity protein TolA [Planctomycetota bacterium]
MKVTAGRTEGGWALGRDHLLEAGGSDPLHIVEVRVEGEDLLLRLRNASAEARVHVFTTRYVPAYDPFARLRAPQQPLPDQVPVAHAESSYHSGREIGDEYRYILERRHAKKFPGNMLRRPGLLLNPWALEETDGAIGEGGDSGGSVVGVGGGAGGHGRGKYGIAGRRRVSAGSFPNLDFLSEPCAVLANLRTDAGGVLRVPLAKLGDGQQVHAVAADGESTVYASLALPEKALAAADRRLALSLDPAAHLAERRSIDFVDAGATAVIEDAANASVETYDSLAAVHRLFLALSGNQELLRFAFVLRWPELTPEEKRALYSQHACHELHFFIQQKDPQFFAEVVKPYLANKAHKTFLDRWLLGEDLSCFLDPWAFSRLNVVEQILLSRRLEGEAEAVARHVRDLVDLVPADPEQEALRFATALKSLALAPEQEESLGKKLEEARAVLEKPAAPAPREDAPAETAVLRRNQAAKGGLEDALAALEPEKAEADGADRKEPAKSKQDKDAELRADARRLYRAPAKTRRYVEHNYWRLRLEQQDAGLIAANAFWRDFAEAKGRRPFCSTRFPEAAGSFAEMMFALAVLDLPFQAGEHAVASAGGRLSLAAASPLLLVRQEIEEAQPAAEKPPILLSQNFFRLDDRYEFAGSERREKFVTDEFLAGVAYGCQVVLTNPTSSPRKLELLLQIPRGALPVRNGFVTRGVPARIEPYGTATFEYAFYFPAAGDYRHFPAHASLDGELVACAEPAAMHVVLVPSRVDATSWEHVSQSGTPEQVLAYLEAQNLERLDLTRVAWRMRERAVFDAVLALLRRRHVYQDTLWSYGLKHGDESAGREYLRHAEAFLARCGRCLDSPLVTIDPIERLAYQHVEYEPLFNPRAHRFGKRREILNPDLAGQYRELLDILACRTRLDDADWLSVTYYLLLQDRVEEALATCARVDAARLPMALQHDYLRAYLDFFSDEHALARDIAERYADYPVERWRNMFQDVLNQLDEAKGQPAAAGEAEEREGAQDGLAAREPALELKVEGQRVSLSHQNVASCEINYYAMDIEFLFSTSPFVQQGLGSFAYIRPNRTDRVALAAGESETSLGLPAELQNQNVLVEARAGGITRRQAYFANSLAVQMIEAYGQLKVTRAGSGAPLSKVYVKVYARGENGVVRFHKDGYTDLRGRFDYASLSGEGAGDAARYALLVLSEQDGAVIREAAPPAQ